MTPLPWQPLADLAARQGFSLKGLARHSGIPRRTLQRWSAAGGIPAASWLLADEVAGSLGVLPDDIWPEWEAVTADVRCPRYEARKAAFRERWATDEELRVRRNAARRERYWENRDAELERQRAYDNGRKDDRRAYRARRNGHVRPGQDDKRPKTVDYKEVNRGDLLDAPDAPTPPADACCTPARAS